MPYPKCRSYTPRVFAYHVFEFQPVYSDLWRIRVSTPVKGQNISVSPSRIHEKIPEGILVRIEKKIIPGGMLGRHSEKKLGVIEMNTWSNSRWKINFLDIFLRQSLEEFLKK